MANKLHDRISLYVQKLEQFADRIWYPPLIALLAAVDNIIIVIPNDGILIASSMLVPKRWAIFAISIAIGSTLGAVALGAVVEHQGLPWILEFYPGIQQTWIWTWSSDFFEKYGLFLVFAVGAAPVMQQPAIILVAIAHTPLMKLMAVFFAGRLIKFGVMAFLGSHSPRLVKKIWGIKDELKDAGVKID